MVGKHKFKVGDVVKVIKQGSGCDDYEIGKIVIITHIGMYGESSFGYKVYPKIGNGITGEFNSFIGEKSFKLSKRDKVIYELW